MSTTTTGTDTYPATIQLPSDGDLRNAASVNAGLQGLANRCTALKVHSLGDAGGTWTAATAITVAGAGMTLSGANHAVTGTLSVNSGGTVAIKSGGKLDVQSGSTLEVDAGATATISADLTVYGDVVFRGRTEVASSGHFALRVEDGSDSASTYYYQQTDVVVVPTLTANRTYKIAAGSYGGERITFLCGEGNHTYYATVTGDSGVTVYGGSLQIRNATGFYRAVTYTCVDVDVWIVSGSHLIP